MRMICAPQGHPALRAERADRRVVLYTKHASAQDATIGGAVAEHVARNALDIPTRAWDLLSIALSVVAADSGVQRNTSPDGWTREIQLAIAVVDRPFWNTQLDLLTRQLRFLTTDRWEVSFLPDGGSPPQIVTPTRLPNDSVTLLSGGLDSMIGALDLVSRGKKPYAVSQVSQGDKETQAFFADRIGGGLSHLQLNHNLRSPGVNERSQRTRSILFLAYGILGATALQRHHEGQTVPLFVCENGLISINPPLTGARIGGLSTRTTHPYFFRQFQQLSDNARLRVQLENPYRFKTKGEMMRECSQPDLLRLHAHKSTSCGRFARTGFTHCGRCVPCLIRRAAFHASRIPDKTGYKYGNLSRRDERHAGHDDVRSALIGIEQAREEGVSTWAGPALSTALISDAAAHKETVRRGLVELEGFLAAAGAK